MLRLERLIPVSYTHLKLALNDEILLKIEKPARYIGGEYNSVMKDPEKVAIRFAMCFPDVYEIGMSHLGIQILYDMFNRREDVWCERVYSPWVDQMCIRDRQTRALYNDRRTIPAVHPRYANAYHYLYGKSQEDINEDTKGGTFGIRLFLCALMFAAFLTIDKQKQEVFHMSSSDIALSLIHI